MNGHKYLINASDVFQVGLMDGMPMLFNVIGAPIDYETCKMLWETLSQYMELGAETINTLNREATEAYFDRPKTTSEQAPPRRAGFVYLLECNCKYKIGYAKNVQSRVSSMQSSSPDEITVVCTIPTADMRELERLLHEKYAEKRLSGEWFALNSSDVEYIRGLA